MFMLNMILSFAGIIFFVFGFLICFKKKHSIVTFFVKNKGEGFAEQVGLISLMSGMIYIFAGIIGLVSASFAFTLMLMIACVALTLSFLTVSTLKAQTNE